MFYVLFTYSKGPGERDFRKFRSEDELIDFLHVEYERIDIVQILGVEKTYRLGLVETKDVIKSALMQTEEEAVNNLKQTLETDLPDPKEQESIIPEIKLSSKGKDLSEEEIVKKNKAALERADKAIEAAKKNLAKKEIFIPKPDKKESAKRVYERKKDHKKDWPTCPDCKKNAMAPWNKSDRCSECQQYKKIPKKK